MKAITKATTELLESMFGHSIEVRAALEDFKSTKRFKSAISEECTTLANDNETKWLTLLDAITIVTDLKLAQIAQVLGDRLGDDFVKPAEVTEGMSEEEKLSRKEAFTVYNLQSRYLLLGVKSAVVAELKVGGKKLLNKLLAPVITAQARVKQDILIVNSVIKSVGRSAKTDSHEVAMAVLSTLEGLDIFTLNRIKTLEGHFEIELKFTDDRKELKTIHSQTDGRFPNLFVTKIAGSIVKRKKEAYVQSIVGLDPIDYLQSIPLCLKGGVDIEEAAQAATDYSIKEEDGTSIMDADWKHRVHQEYLDGFNVINTFGKVYDNYGTDGVARVYSESRFSIQHKATEHYLEFANKQVLNEVGKKYIKILIVDSDKYKIDGVKPTEEEALEYFELHKNELAVKFPDLFSRLESSEPNGFVMEVDAQTQGASIYGACTLSLPLLTMTGLIGDSFRTDLYLALAKKLNAQLGTNAYTRDNVKTALMTAGYGAKKTRILVGDGTVNMKTGEYTVIQKGKKQVPLMATANKAGITDVVVVWTAFEKAMKILVPHMLEAQAKLEYLAGKNVDTNIMEFTMPDGVECSIIDSKTETRQVEWIDNAGNKHSVKHAYTVPDNGNVTSAAPRFIQAIDAYILRVVVRIMASLGLDIQVNHDGYFVHPNDVDTVREAYRLAVIDVMERDLLTNIARQAFNDDSIRSFQLRNVNLEELVAKVAESKYFLYV